MSAFCPWRGIKKAGEDGMKKLKIGGCTRCAKGDVALDKDQYGWYEYCLQCGHMRELSGIFINSIKNNPLPVVLNKRGITSKKEQVSNDLSQEL